MTRAREIEAIASAIQESGFLLHSGDADLSIGYTGKRHFPGLIVAYHPAFLHRKRPVLTFRVMKGWMTEVLAPGIAFPGTEAVPKRGNAALVLGATRLGKIDGADGAWKVTATWPPQGWVTVGARHLYTRPCDFPNIPKPEKVRAIQAYVVRYGGQAWIGTESPEQTLRVALHRVAESMGLVDAPSRRVVD